MLACLASFVALCHVGENIRGGGGGLMAVCEGGWGDPGGGGQLWTVHDQVVSEEILNSYYVWYS